MLKEYKEYKRFMNFGKDIQDFSFEIYYNQMHLNFLASHMLFKSNTIFKNKYIFP